MSELIETPIHPADRRDITLRLHHLVPGRGGDAAGPRKPVLLLHGASANHETFTAPSCGTLTPPCAGLAGWLADGPDEGQRFDVWLLDWRGSSFVTDDPGNLPTLSPGIEYNFNAAAQFDIRAALDEMARQGTPRPIAMIGHCMGGGILAEAIARGHVNEKDADCIVLSTLGLFYETPLDSRMKSEDRVLERLAKASTPAAPFVFVDPRVTAAKGLPQTPWPEDLESLFRNWPGGQFHEDRPGEELSAERTMANHMCNRLSFMYGMVYNHANLAEEIHGSDHPTLGKKFGAIPLHMYIHAARNIRQGHATLYNLDAQDADASVGGTGNPKENGTQPQTITDRDFISAEALARFRNLSHVTLVTGALNRLWHRESIDLMYEWLCRGSADFVRKVTKLILPSYGHQDLLWGKNAAADVFPAIAQGLTAQEPDDAVSRSLHWRASQGIPSREAAASPRR
jgi:cholesterol oxidase